jgi:hypothetical protein
VRGDPKRYMNAYIYQMNKRAQEEADRKAPGAQHPYKKKVVKPGDDEYVEDVL